MSHDLGREIGDVARELFGDPNKGLSTKVELRFGNNGSLSVDLQHGRWFDHEHQAGGNVLELVKHAMPDADPVEWLRERGYLPVADAPRAKQPTNGAQHGSRQSLPTATYVYRDTEGTPRYRVARYEWIEDGKRKKTFRQERYDPSSDRYVSGKGCMDGVELVPYRVDEWLPELSMPALVVEGEKDADRLWSIGFAATCNPGGAGKWRPDWAPLFDGREVIVIPDNDEAGRKHAAEVIRSLRANASTVVRILELHGLPPKCDVSDWLDAGHDQAQLERLMREAPIADDLSLARLSEGKAPLEPFYFIPIDDLDATFPPRPFVVEGWIPSGCVTSLYGEGGTGKSFLAIMIGMCVAAGRDWLGFRCEQSAVMALMCEDDEDEIKRRRNKIARALRFRREELDGRLYLSPRVGLPNTLMEFPGGVPRRTELFDHAVSEAKRVGARLVILDNAGQLFAGNENDRGQVTAFLNAVAGIAIAIGGAVLLLGHPPKSEGSTYSGSTAWDAVVRSRIWFERVKTAEAEPDAAVRYTLNRLKANYAQQDKIELVLDPVSEVVVRAAEYVEPVARQEQRQRRIGEARQHILETLDVLVRRGEATSQSARAQNFLPKVMAQSGMAKDFAQIELRRALDGLLDDSFVTQGVVGRYDNRTARYGLVRASSQS